MLGGNVESPMGISSSEAASGYQERIAAFGRNEYPRPDPATFLELFWGALQDTTLIILIVSAVVSLVLGILFPAPGEEGTSWIEGAAILMAVFLVSVVTAVNDWNKERQFRSLSREGDRVQYDVWRGGELHTVEVADLLVGDIVALAQGDRVPADGLFVDGRGCGEVHVDESVMTGETVEVVVDEESPVMLSGTLIQEGMAHMLVVANGSRSQWGQLLANLTDEKPPTPLQVFLDQLAVWIGYGGLAVAFVVFAVLFVWWLFGLWFGSLPLERCADVSLGGDAVRLCWREIIDNDFSMDQISLIVNMFIIAVTIVVVAVPEGLPLAVTLSLAYSMRAMMKDQVLVRHLDSCETMGGATNICSDKTGTLTENRMSVVRGSIAGTSFESAAGLQLSERVAELMCRGVALNSTARFEMPSEFDSSLGRLPTYLGSKTECAMLYFCDQVTRRMGAADYDYVGMRETTAAARLYAFNSDRKRMSVVVPTNDASAAAFRMYTKGASEVVLARCVRVVRADGGEDEIDEAARAMLERQIEDMARDGLRTIALAYREFADSAEWQGEEEQRSDNTPEHELVLLGLVGIEDPLRPEVIGAVQQCQSAGIFVRMVTGDNIMTASKIARDCGILTEDGLAMEGDEFRKLDERRLDEVLPRLQVLARSKPLDKKILVEALMKRQEVVAVTGDGTNDAPALRRAHVGLSMGIAGTMVAKQASDVVILDDNFASIVKAVMWGRCVYDNIRKFLQFQLTVNFSALVVAFVGAVTGRGTPLNAIQLLWVNLIMDTMAALALGTEKPTPDLLDRKPYGLKDRFISNLMLRNVIGQGLYQIVVLCGLLYLAPLVLPWQSGGLVHYTVIFNTFVWMQVFNEVNSRKVNNELNVFAGIHRNYLFLGVLIFTAVMQVVMVFVGGAALKVTPLGPFEWLLCLALAGFSLPLNVILHFIPVPKQATGINEVENPDDSTILQVDTDSDSDVEDML